MISASTIALYLGESYASLGAYVGVLDSSQKEIFEKSVFLPQVSLKNLLLQTKNKLDESASPAENFDFYVVTKYLDRLKSFRLGGSVTQVVAAGFENSYSAINTKSLSLAAASLVISVTAETLTLEFLEAELIRIRKINPDTTKVAIQLPEKLFSAELRERVHSFFSEKQFHIFSCAQSENLSEVRKTLLNAGTEGTKDEVISDIKEVFGEAVKIHFWCDGQFKTNFENHELFGSCSSFLASLGLQEKCGSVAYFDHECFRLIQTKPSTDWTSPWGTIPIPNYEVRELAPHPFSEIRLDHLSMLNFSNTPTQYEPGPVCAGRGIKPLVIDLFCEDMATTPMFKSLFAQSQTETLKQKLDNHLSVIEKGQSENAMKTNRTEIKKQIVENIKHEITMASTQNKVKLTGPLASVFGMQKADFSWPQEILKKVSLQK